MMVIDLAPLNEFAPYFLRRVKVVFRYDGGRRRRSHLMNNIAALLVFVSLAVPATAVELFRYGGAARDGGTLEYVFETDEGDLPQTVT
jgi:hypothetical protein